MFGLINWSYPRNAIVNDPLSIHDVGRITRKLLKLVPSITNKHLTITHGMINNHSFYEIHFFDVWRIL